MKPEKTEYKVVKLGQVNREVKENQQRVIIQKGSSVKKRDISDNSMQNAVSQQSIINRTSSIKQKGEWKA